MSLCFHYITYYGGLEDGRVHSEMVETLLKIAKIGVVKKMLYLL